MKKNWTEYLAMIETITESGMDFIADNVFHIEKSPFYTRLRGSVKSVEFVRAKGCKLMFVEAKSSFPKLNDTDDKKSTRFREEVEEMCDKFVHSLNLYSSIDVGVADNGFPADFKPADKVSLVFILVINGFKTAWCDPIKKALRNRVRQSRCMANIWKPEIFVINEKTAAARKLITN
jgi:hypothetical protein